MFTAEELNAIDIGFEKEIWDAACVLRGNMDASEYKNVILVTPRLVVRVWQL